MPPMLDKLVNALKWTTSKPPVPGTRARITAQNADSKLIPPIHKKKYVPPIAYKLNFEQGALILLGRAWDGDKEAKAFLTHLFPSKTVRPEISGQAG
jgi:hypothetical protein